MPELPEVSVIMPTCALAARARLIHRALESVLSQERVLAVPIVVVNGPNRDPSLVREMRRNPRIRLIEVEEASLPGAFRAGREAVQSEWFSALDDDDEYLPGTLAARVDTLESRSVFDTVVTRGLVRSARGERPHPRDVASIERDPLGALTRGNWLLPGAWLCRSERVGCWIFEGMPRYLECTYLAIQFALHCRPCFLDQPGVAWYVSTPASESKSREYVEGQMPALDRLLELPLPTQTRRWILHIKAAEQHGIATMRLQEGALSEAWRWHVRSLIGRDGLRFMSFSLRLLLASMRS